MLWIIIILALVVMGVIMSIKEKEVYLLMWMMALAIIFTFVMVANNSQIYGNQLCRIKNYEKSIPFEEAKLGLLVKMAIAKPSAYAELIQYRLEQEEIATLRKNIAKNKAKYYEEVNHLQLRNPWTNIFVLFNGRFTEQPLKLHQNCLPYPGM